MTNTSDFLHFHHFPPGSPPKMHNRLHAANLHQTASPLPTQKPKKARVAAARPRLSALRFRHSEDLRLSTFGPWPYPTTTFVRCIWLNQFTPSFTIRCRST